MEKNGPWSREQLSELVKDAEIALRSIEGFFVPVPDWLAEAAADVIEGDSKETMEMTHPDDQSRVVERFITAVGQPNEPVPFSLRSSRHGDWQHFDSLFLNLCDNADVGAMLLVPCPARDRQSNRSTNRVGANTRRPTGWCSRPIRGRRSVRRY